MAFITGGSGNDTLTGTAGTDIIQGNAGDDVIYAGAGDSPSGNADTDTIYITDEGYHPTFPNSIMVNGGSGGNDVGTDAMDVSQLIDNGWTFTSGTVSGTAITDLADWATHANTESHGQLIFTNGSGDTYRINYVQIGQLSGINGSSNGVVDGAATGETMGVGFTDGDGDQITAGDDTIYGNAGDDTIDGGAGNDTIDGGSGQNLIYGGAGDDSITGGETDSGSQINGLTTGATIYGGDGNDAIDSVFEFADTSNQNVITYGGAGDDTIRLTSDDVGETAFGGDGDDVITSSDKGNYGSANINDSIDGGAGNDSIDAGNADDSVTGGAGNDTIEGGTGDDVLSGGLGSDTLYGGDGADTLISTTNEVTSDSFFGGAGNDTIRIEGDFTGNDTIDGGTGNDTLDLDPVDNRNLTVNMVAGEVTDGTVGAQEFTSIENVTTGAGDDSILGDGNANTLSGGAGNDTIDGGAGGDSLDGGDGIDTLDYSSDTTGVSVHIGANTASGGDATGDTIANFEGVIGGSGSDTLGGSSGDDTLIGNAGNDNINGAIGNDLIDGGAGRDILVGAQGDDTIYGGDGDEFVAGGTGKDTIYGGNDNDDLFGGDDDDTIFGGSGNDFIQGGSGDDTITLGTGNDTYEMAGGGDDTITDFTSGDQLKTDFTTDAGNTDTNQDGTVTADEVTVTGGGGSDQVLTFPGGETVTVPDGTIDTSTPQAQFASLVAMGVPPCFAPGTRILTPHGERRVEDLRIGDLVITADHGPQPLRWIGRREVIFGPGNPRGDKDKPVLISKGALGQGLPRRDLVVSPQHRMVLTDADVAEAFGAREVFAIAKALTGLKGVRVMWGKQRVSYHALLLARHEVIFAEGAPTESFRPGPVALAGFSEAHRAEIFRIYPGLADHPETALGPPARTIVSKRSAKEFLFAWRHRSVPKEVVKQRPIELRVI